MNKQRTGNANKVVKSNRELEEQKRDPSHGKTRFGSLWFWC